MKVKDIYSYEFDTLTEILHIEFSLEGDSDDSYRLLEMESLEIIDTISNPSVLEEYELEDLMEDRVFVYETLVDYVENNSDDLPPEEFL